MFLPIKGFLNNKFVRSSLIYTLGSMMTPLMGLILLPVFTKNLSPAEYGTMTTVQAFAGILQIVLLLSLHGAITRFYFDFLKEPEKRKEYLGSIFSFVVLFSSVTSVFLIITSDFIGPLIFNSIPTNPFYYYFIGLAWVNSLIALPLALLRAQERPLFFILINIFKALLIMILTVYLIIYKGMGAESVLIAHITITFGIVVISYLALKNHLRISFNVHFIKNSLLFSLPLLPHVAGTWIISSSDRFILEKFVSISSLGIYSLAAQVSMILSLFYTSLNNALVPRYTMLRKEGKDSQANKLLRTFSYVILITGIVSIPIAMGAINLLSSEQYFEANQLVPYLLIGQVISGLYLIPSAKLFYTKNTKAIAKSSSIAAIINIIVNVLTIPIIGLYGAVLSTIIAEIIRLSLIYQASKKV